MNKYWIFRELLEFMANNAEVVDADMDNYCGDMEISGEADGQIITIKVSMKEKEENKND